MNIAIMVIFFFFHDGRFISLDFCITIYQGRVIFNFNLIKCFIYSNVDANNNSNAKCTVFIEGPETAAEVNYLLAREGLEDKFPLFTAVHRLVMHRVL